MTKSVVRATGSQYLPYVMAGSWKFQTKPRHPFGVTTEEITETAIAMVNARIGTGTYLHVFVRGTGQDEIGICFMYKIDHDESEGDLRLKYEDFFKRRHGAAFKGWSLGYEITTITLES